MSSRSRLVLLALWVAMAACKKDPPPPPPEPPKCARVERGGDVIIEEVLCSGRDADEDGVDDAVDLCPDLLEVPNGVEDKDGCPDPDEDRDGFVDYEDACPQEPGAPPDGCVAKDRDGDAVADHLDACPDQPEDLDEDRDADGCPDGAAVAVARARDDQLWQVARVEVRRGKPAPTKAGKESLEALVDEVLARAGEVARVRIVAYASLRETSKGRAKALAERRAKVVRRALVEAGVKDEAFEVAVYPLKDAKERVGRVDVMVFLPLSAVLAPKPPPRAGATSGADAIEAGDLDAGAASAEWDAEVLPEPYPEPAEAPAEDDWDL